MEAVEGTSSCQLLSLSEVNVKTFTFNLVSILLLFHFSYDQFSLFFAPLLHLLYVVVGQYVELPSFLKHTDIIKF